jgi:hypothetical protein
MPARLSALLLALLVGGCALLPGERPNITVGNGTELVVRVFVNEVAVGEFSPDGPQPEIDESSLPPLPWDIEARTITGRPVLALHVEPGQLRVDRHADGGISASIAMARVDLSCGTLWLWAGEITPGGPAPNPDAGKPGDCVP